MKAVAVQISYIKEWRGVRAMSYFFAIAFLLMLAVNALFVGLTIGARAGGARASESSEVASSEIADFESKLPNLVVNEEIASEKGFAVPISSSYTTARPIGRAVSSNEL